MFHTYTPDSYNRQLKDIAKFKIPALAPMLIICYVSTEL